MSKSQILVKLGNQLCFSRFAEVLPHVLKQTDQKLHIHILNFVEPLPSSKSQARPLDHGSSCRGLEVEWTGEGDRDPSSLGATSGRVCGPHAQAGRERGQLTGAALLPRRC